MTGYRWHFWDPIPFTKSLVFDIEHLGWTYNQDGAIKSAFGVRNDLMSSVVVLVPGRHRDRPAARALRLGASAAGQRAAVRGRDRRWTRSRAEKGKASLVRDLFWSKDVVVFEAEGPGSKLEIPFDVAEAGDYELYTQVAQGSDYGIYTVLLDGKPAGRAGPRARAGRGRAAAAVVRRLRVRDVRRHGLPDRMAAPVEGQHTVTFVCLGKNAASSGYALGVDNLDPRADGPRGLEAGRGDARSRTSPREWRRSRAALVGSGPRRARPLPRSSSRSSAPRRRRRCRRSSRG